MKLNMIFKNNIEIAIELFDKPAVRKWFDHFKQMHTSYYRFDIIETYKKEPPDENKITEHWTNILQALAILNSDLNIPDKFDFNQRTLNMLHRFFTSNFGILDFEIINQINESVHRLECYTVPGANSIFYETLIPTNLHCNVNRDGNDKSPWLTFSEKDQQLNYEYLDMDQQNLVLLDMSILGKCVLQSFIEDDDPTKEDCTGRLGSFGGFFIDLNDNRRKIYKSTQFKDWIKSYNMNNIPYEFPIGYVKDEELKKFKKEYKFIFDRVEFI